MGIVNNTKDLIDFRCFHSIRNIFGNSYNVIKMIGVFEQKMGFGVNNVALLYPIVIELFEF